MTRVCITILACFLFLVFGAIGEELPNLLAIMGDVHHKDLMLPPLTWLYREAFPMNCNVFLMASMPFYAAMIGALLLSFQSDPATAAVKFLEHSFIIGLLFGIHFGLNLLALLLPHHLLLTMMNPEKSWNFINIVLDIANVVLWVAVIVLAIRLFLRRKKS